MKHLRSGLDDPVEESPRSDTQQQDPSTSLPFATSIRKNALTAYSALRAHRVGSKRDDCGETIIPGTVGHLYEHSDGTHFGVLLMFATKHQWSSAKKTLMGAGFTIRQDGDTEGTALFNPADHSQAQLALRVAGVRFRRVLTDGQRQAAATHLARVRPPLLKAA
jgi:hypothetical protein